MILGASYTGISFDSKVSPKAVSMFRWTRIKHAEISSDQRAVFERYGENVIAMVLATGLTPSPGELYQIYANGPWKESARDWLTERSTFHERREDRLEAMELSILVLVAMEVLFEIARAFHLLR